MNSSSEAAVVVEQSAYLAWEDVREGVHARHRLVGSGAYARCSCGVEFYWPERESQYGRHRDERLVAMVAARVRAEALAGERQRWERLVQAHMSLDGVGGPDQAARNSALRQLLAAGSVPVATPDEDPSGCPACGASAPSLQAFISDPCQDDFHSLPVVPVATPTEPDGAALIATERRRQVTTEGYTPEHDAECERDGQLAAAAAAYCLPFTMLTMYEPGDGVPSQDQGVWHPACWPWAVRYWKPTPDDRVRELVKAGALIAAEIDRLLAASPVPAVPDDLGSLQRQAIAARARGDFAAERAALDRIIVLERSPVPVEQPEPKGVAGHAPGCDGWRPPTALGFGRSIPERCKPGCPRSEQPETAVYVTPGHPTVAGPGYNCGCGQCLHARRSPAGQPEER